MLPDELIYLILDYIPMKDLPKLNLPDYMKEREAKYIIGEDIVCDNGVIYIENIKKGRVLKIIDGTYIIDTNYNLYLRNKYIIFTIVPLWLICPECTKYEILDIISKKDFIYILLDTNENNINRIDWFCQLSLYTETINKGSDYLLCRYDHDLYLYTNKYVMILEDLGEDYTKGTFIFSNVKATHIIDEQKIEMEIIDDNFHKIDIITGKEAVKFYSVGDYAIKYIDKSGRLHINEDSSETIIEYDFEPIDIEDDTYYIHDNKLYKHKTLLLEKDDYKVTSFELHKKTLKITFEKENDKIVYFVKGSKISSYKPR